MNRLTSVVAPRGSFGDDRINAVVRSVSGLDGTKLVAALAAPLIEHARSSAASNENKSERLFAEVRESLLPAWNLGWSAYQAELGLARCLVEYAPSEILLAAGRDELSIIVCAQILFDHATFVRSYLPLRQGLNALESALPSGCATSDFPLFQAVNVLANVHEACRVVVLADSDAAAVEQVELPSSNRFVAAEQLAVELDGELNPGERRPWGVKTTSYLMRCAALLPLPDSRRSQDIPGVTQCYQTVLEVALRSLTRDGRSRNGDSDVLFRTARCRYALGNLEDALSDIEQAIDLHDGSSVYISEQYHQFRLRLETEASFGARVETVMGRFEDALTARLNNAQNELRRTAGEAEAQTRRQIADSTFRVVEILGVFLALIGFMATAVGTAVLAEGNVLQRAGLLIGGWLGSVGFFWLLRRIVRP